MSFAASSAVAQDETKLLDTETNQGEIIVFHGPDDLHLDPATVIIAVDVYGDDNVDVNGVTFIADKSDDNTTGVAEANGVTVTTTAANQIDAWSATTTFVGADQDSADNLATVMESIRWEGAPNPVTIEVEGLVPGAAYEVQLLTNEGRGPTRYRVWDIMVEEELVADNISSIGRLNEDEWDETNSAAYRGVFAATAGGTLSIVMAQDLGGDPFGGVDNNPILNAIVIHAAATPDPLADGLVGYWPLDGSADDVIGSYHGEAMGSEPLTYDAGKLGGAGVDLDGIDQFIQISGDEDVFDFGAPDEPTGFTISAWYRVDAFTKSWQCLVAKGEGNRWRVHRRGADAPAVFAANGGNADVPAYDGSAYPIDDGEYHHVAVVSVPEDRVELWLDGDLVSTGPAPALENGANPMMIGENPDALGRTWDGGVDDVAAWNRPLSEDEVQRIFAQGQEGNSIGDLINGGSDNDRDKDGLPNFYEEANGLNPDDPADAALDGDGDGLTNLQEYERRTDITKADTDGDGLNDKVETGTGLWVSATDTGTDPRKPDTDKDGLSDGVETNTGVFVSKTDTGTNPHNDNTDGDNFGDALEVNFCESNPVDANSGCEGPELIAFWNFDDPSDPAVAVDLAADIIAEVDASYTESGGGRTGEGGDYALSFVDGGTAHVPNAEFLNFAGAVDLMTVSLWQKNTGTRDASSFWMLADGYDRAFQAHMPWSNNNIYFDTAGGCCAAGQRLNFDPSVELEAFDFLDDQWHHYAFVKDGTTKQVWIDGEMAFESPDADPLPTEAWTDLFIGSASGGANSADGLIDDFAVYAIALKEDAIKALAAGESPIGGGGRLPFQINAIGRTAEGVTLSWPSRANKEYSVEYAQPLSGDSWIELDDGVAAEGDETSWTDDDAARVALPEGWYRIREN